MRRSAILLFAFFGLLTPATSPVGAQDWPSPQAPAYEDTTGLSIPEAARASDHFDADAATNAYLASVPADAAARSDAYFEGGYWLLLWNFLLSAGILVFLLASGLSARMRDVARRVTRVHGVHVFLYWAQFAVITGVLAFPLTVWQGYVREHHYGLSNQTVGAWMGDQLKGLALGVVLGGLFVVLLYWVLRRAPRTWWIWGTGVSLLGVAVASLIGPVFIAPLFNTYTRLEDARVREPILAMARANGIPASDVYVSDASRQTTRVSANVSGFLGTQRITLNDNLLNRATLPEIEMVMGHEMGHYVLNHAYKSMLFTGVTFLLMFALLYHLSRWALGRWGDGWRVHEVSDPAALPLLVLLLTAMSFVATPVANSWIRVQEQEADMFGLNASRQPDGLAVVSLKLGEYRKLDPGHWEEIIFFDHPSGRTRIYSAMRWKAEHLAGVGSERGPVAQAETNLAEPGEGPATR